jgi:predicted dehydrogenase
MLSEIDLDVVLVTMHDHADPSIAAMRAGKHVMVEKPMAFNLEQADRMLAAAKENDVKLMVAYMKRYDPAYEWALPQLKAMEDIRLIRMHDFAGGYEINDEIYDLAKPIDVPEELIEEHQAKMNAAKLAAIGEDRSEYLAAYNTLLYLCSHDAIILQEAFGPPTRILHVDIFEDLFVVAILEYGESTRCIWESGMILEISDWDEQLMAYGGKRRIEIKFPFPYLRNAATVVNVNDMEGKANAQKKYVVSFDEAFKREWRHFYECVTEDKEPITSGEKGRADLALLIDLVKAARP